MEDVAMDELQKKAQYVAQLLSVLSNENRLRILCELLERPMTVGELAEAVPNISAPALSQHLNKLRSVSFVASEKQGQYLRYSITDERLYGLMAYLKQEFCD